MPDLFADQDVPGHAARNAAPPMRRSPTGFGRSSLDEVVGQEHLTGPEGAIGRMVAAGGLPR